jgi:hypothetical protein
MIEDINKRITEVEEKVKMLEKSLERFKQEVIAGINVANRDEFGKEKLYPNIEVADGELKIGVDNEYYNVVEAGKFWSTINNVINKLEESRVVVLTGPRGIGKSVLAASVIWKLLDSGEVGLVARVDELNENNDSEFKRFIRNYSREFKTVFGRLLILYDPSSTKIYERERKKQPIPANINDTIELLTHFELTEDSMMLIVLPSDIYHNIPSEDTKKSLEQYRIEVELNDIEFLSEIIREYSATCRNKLSENELSELASEVAKYEEGYTLIARLVGMELTKSNCNLDDIKRMIKESEHKASAFIAGFINKWFDVIDDRGQVNSKRINALAEILAIRRPFAESSSPNTPILTKGIAKLIERVNDSEKEMSDEMVNWLTRRSHDLIEDTIKRLLDGEDLEKASKPWRSISVPKITSVVEAVEHFVKKYGETFFEKLLSFSGCWKRVALIIGHVLTMHLMPDKVEYSDSAVADVLNYCDIDDYLLVNNEIPFFVEMLIMNLYLSGSSPFTRIFTNKYENAIEEAKKLLEIWRRKFNEFEAYYALGLTLIVAEAARLGKTINEDDADVILKTTSTAIKLTIHPLFVKHILEALEPLRDKAPQQYLVILLEASRMELDKNTARLIYDELNYMLSNFFSKDTNKNRLSELVWPLTHAVEVCSNMLDKHIMYFTKEEVENIVKNMCDLLNALKKKKESNELAIIAEAHALRPAFYSKIRDFMSEYCSVSDPVIKAVEVRESLKELANKSDELLKNKYFMNWVTVAPWISPQQNIKELITNLEALLTFSLAKYKFYNDELNEASKLFNEVAEAYKSIEDWGDYIGVRTWFLRAELIKARSINEYVNVASNFEKLWNETLKNPEYMVIRLMDASAVLGNYLVYLASVGRYDDTEKTLSSWHEFLNHYKKVSVLTRLMLRLLGFTKVDEVKPEELIDAYKDDIIHDLLPALRLTLDIEASIEECESLTYRDICRYAFLAVKGNSYALTMLRNSLNVEILKLVQGLDGKVLVQLLAPMTSRCRLALMLYALVSGNAELAKEHARWGSEKYGEKNRLVGRLFGDVYEICCDVNSEGFKLALLKLYYSQV